MVKMNFFSPNIFAHYLFIYLAILNPIQHGSTCYPGIICDGTETTLTDCKYDRELASTKPQDLYAIITRCIGRNSFVFIHVIDLFFYKIKSMVVFLIGPRGRIVRNHVVQVNKLVHVLVLNHHHRFSNLKQPQQMHHWLE